MPAWREMLASAKSRIEAPGDATVCSHAAGRGSPSCWTDKVLMVMLGTPGAMSAYASASQTAEFALTAFSL